MASGITPSAREYKWIVYFGETPKLTSPSPIPLKLGVNSACENRRSCNFALMLDTHKKARFAGLFEYPVGMLSQASGYLLLASL
jgi:hypothetical protein